MERRSWEYTLREVATLAGVSVDTAKRRLKQGAFPHARQLPGPVATWLVPLQDIVASGLHLSGSTLPEQGGVPPRESNVAANRPEHDLVELRITAAVAEAEARVHRLYADALRGALEPGSGKA